MEISYVSDNKNKVVLKQRGVIIFLYRLKTQIFGNVAVSGAIKMFKKPTNPTLNKKI